MIDLTGYKLTFSDEFSGNSLSRDGVNSTWGYVRPALGPDATVDHYFSDAAFVAPESGYDPFSIADGALQITAISNVSAITGRENWASGLIQTANGFDQLYGYFEIRAALPAEAGTWPAFWLLPADGSWPPEIDVLETYGSTTLHQTIHKMTPSGRQFEEIKTELPDRSAGYHTYGVLWDPDTITFYYDGAVTGSLPTPADFHTSMHLLVDLAVQDGAGVTGDPKSMSVDYVRAFSNASTATAVDLGPVSSPDGADTSGLYGATAAGMQAPQPEPETDGPAGPDRLVIRVSGDWWQDDPLFTVSIDGVMVGGLHRVTAAHARGEWQDVVVEGDFGASMPQVSINFVNDAWGGTDSADRNLYVDRVTYNGSIVEAEDATASDGYVTDGAVMLYGNGAVQFGSAPPPPSAALTGDGLVLRVSGDAWRGEAQFVVAVDGVVVGGLQTVTARHDQGEWQDIVLDGDLGADPAEIAVRFVNDAWGGEGNDRNLYVDRIQLGGEVFEAEATLRSDGFVKDGNAVMLFNNGNVVFDLKSPASPPATSVPPESVDTVPDTDGLDRLVVRVSGDSWEGEPALSISVDGKPLDETYSVTAAYGAGEWQEIVIEGDFGAAPESVAVNFLNDAWGGSDETDRNLYVDAITLNGHLMRAENAMASDGFVNSANSVMLFNNGSVVFPYLDWA